MTPDAAPPCQACAIPRCEELFHLCLAADFASPQYFAAHHLVVPTYLLQHDRYARSARDQAVAFILSHLDTAPSDHEKAEIRQNANGPIVLCQPPSPGTGIAWPLTVADVDTSTPDRYGETVRAWAESVASTVAEH